MMKHLLAALFFCFSFISGYAQFITPLESYPKPVTSGRNQLARISTVGDTLDLPFFDDFSGQFNGAPNTLHWQPGGGPMLTINLG
ncbi:hypothetical protein HUW51_23285 [Adhaeribacter swui]|uniref:Uncharacterized protein n=1 Tax=Adhaeribacter swui TaxID=2086471 RepID=A0A7G7GEA3_9BACT|nr:hypothetical protein [Adhaeribacter swui]QNF35487.1 hypothetical protein HUW51_23285 [Adhaeribacter swui]